MASMPASSNEDVYVGWGADAVGQPVEIAIVRRTVPEAEPVDADYKDAEWDGTTGQARLHIGAGSDTPLDAGEYVVWTRLTVGDRRPVRRSGLLVVGTST